MIRLLLLVLIAVVFNITTANAAAFDCGHVYKPAEITICSTPSLSQEDDNMARIFYYMRDRVADRLGFNASQRDWINTRNRCDNSVDCLTNSYSERFWQLCGLASWLKLDLSPIGYIEECSE